MDRSCPATRSAAVCSAGTDILAAVANHGTIMHQLRAAVREVVQRRGSTFDHRAHARMSVCPRCPLGTCRCERAVFRVSAVLYVVDPEGRIRFLNPAALTILGYKDERQLLGRSSHDTTVGTRPLCLNALAFDSERRNAR